MNHTSKPTPASDADPSAVSIDKANELIQKRLEILSGAENVPLLQCRGRRLDADLLAPMHSPPFRASAMDGYAYRKSDGGNERVIVGESFAGHPYGNSLGAGECVHITTGARVPDDADTVIQQENATRSGATMIIAQHPDAIGHHIRAIGSDCEQGLRIACAGARINAGLAGLCAALGMESLNVKRRVRITLISSGDELAIPGSALLDGQIYDANSILLATMLDDPCFEVMVAEPMSDTHTSVNEAMDKAVHSADMIITTGGVSVGARDHLRDVVESRGGVDLWKVAMKPGRPLSFGVIDGITPWFGLPGNPVSAALTSLLFVLPAIRYSQGLPAKQLRTLQARCADDLSKLPGRVEFQRGIACTADDGTLVVSTTGLQDSHVLSSLANANCFIRLPLESDGAKSGDTVTVLPFEFVLNTLA